jgi:hypothetical protein
MMQKGGSTNSVFRVAVLMAILNATTTAAKQFGTGALPTNETIIYTFLAP